MNKEEKEIKEEIRKEFQLDRMILFSDAVFAIAITLMAIEIRLPANSTGSLSDKLLLLLPSVLAYTVSFAFIGQVWYQHLCVFGLLKDFDKGLVVRNLIMLFCIGFFPFSVTLMASSYNSYLLSAGIYFAVLVSCKGAQLMLQHYILVQRPHLRISKGVHEELVRYKKSRLAVILLLICFLLAASTMFLMGKSNYRFMAWWWFVPMSFMLRYFQKKIK